MMDSSVEMPCLSVFKGQINKKVKNDDLKNEPRRGLWKRQHCKEDKNWK